MKKPFFIMIYMGDESAHPITESDMSGWPAFYATYEEAHQVAQDHEFCLHNGYEIFEMGTGRF